MSDITIGVDANNIDERQARRKLIECCKQGDVKTLASILAEKPHLSLTRDRHNRTLLHYTAVMDDKLEDIVGTVNDVMRINDHLSANHHQSDTSTGATTPSFGTLDSSQRRERRMQRKLSCFDYLLGLTGSDLWLASDNNGLTVAHLAVISGNTVLLRHIVELDEAAARVAAESSALVQCKQVSGKDGTEFGGQTVYSPLVFVADCEYHTPLHWAVIANESRAVEPLVAFGGAELIACQDANGACALHYATQVHDFEIFRRKLVAKLATGAQVNNTNDLTSDDIDANPDDSADINSQQQSFTCCRLSVLKRLLAVPRLRIECRDNELRTPLIWAASCGNERALEALLAAGARRDAADANGLTALHCAASHAFANCVRILLDWPLQQGQVATGVVHQQQLPLDKNRCTPLFHAALSGACECIELLASSASAQLDWQDARGRCAAHYACLSGQLTAVQQLARRGANLWLASSSGDLPLHYAIKSANIKLIEWLLERSPYQRAINAINAAGRSALHIAVAANNIELSRFLLDRCANVNQLMKTRGKLRTALDVCKEVHCSKQLYDLLIAHGAHHAPAKGKKQLGSGQISQSEFGNKVETSSDYQKTSEADRLTSSSESNSTVVCDNKKRLRKQQSTNNTNQLVDMQPQVTRNLPSASSGAVDLSAASSPSSSQVSNHNVSSSDEGLYPNKIDSSLQATKSMVTNVNVFASPCPHCSYFKHQLHQSYSITVPRQPTPEAAMFARCELCTQTAVSQTGGRKSSEGVLGSFTGKACTSQEKTDISSSRKASSALRRNSSIASNELPSLIPKSRFESQTDANNKQVPLASKTEPRFDKTVSQLPRLAKQTEYRQQTSPIQQVLSQANETNAASSSVVNISKHQVAKIKSNILPKVNSHWQNQSTNIITNNNSESRSQSRQTFTRQSRVSRASQRLFGLSPTTINNNIDDELDNYDDDEEKFLLSDIDKCLRKLRLESKVFEELQFLKRSQIRSGRANEAVLVKRLIDRYRQHTLDFGLQDYFGSFRYREFEAFLYAQLQRLAANHTAPEVKQALALLASTSSPSNLMFDTTQPFKNAATVAGAFTASHSNSNADGFEGQDKKKAENESSSNIEQSNNQQKQLAEDDNQTISELDETERLKFIAQEIEAEMELKRIISERSSPSGSLEDIPVSVTTNKESSIDKSIINNQVNEEDTKQISNNNNQEKIIDEIIDKSQDKLKTNNNFREQQEEDFAVERKLSNASLVSSRRSSDEIELTRKQSTSLADISEIVNIARGINESSHKIVEAEANNLTNSILIDAMNDVSKKLDSSYLSDDQDIDRNGYSGLLDRRRKSLINIGDKLEVVYHDIGIEIDKVGDNQSDSEEDLRKEDTSDSEEKSLAEVELTPDIGLENLDDEKESVTNDVSRSEETQEAGTTIGLRKDDHVETNQDIQNIQTAIQMRRKTSPDLLASRINTAKKQSGFGMRRGSLKYPPKQELTAAQLHKKIGSDSTKPLMKQDVCYDDNDIYEKQLAKKRKFVEATRLRRRKPRSVLNGSKEKRYVVLIDENEIKSRWDEIKKREKEKKLSLERFGDKTSSAANDDDDDNDIQIFESPRRLNVDISGKKMSDDQQQLTSDFQNKSNITKGKSEVEGMSKLNVKGSNNNLDTSSGPKNVECQLIYELNLGFKANTSSALIKSGNGNDNSQQDSSVGIERKNTNWSKWKILRLIDVRTLKRSPSLPETLLYSNNLLKKLSVLKV